MRFRILLFEGYIASVGASATQAADLQSGDPDGETGLPGNFGLELIEHGARKLLDSTAAKTGEMNVIAPGLDFVVMFFTLQVHQVQLVDESKSFEEFNGSIHRRAVNVWFASSGEFQQGCGIEMLVGVLNNFYEDAALGRQAYALRRKFVQQGPPFEWTIWIGRSSCNKVASMGLATALSCDAVAIGSRSTGMWDHFGPCYEKNPLEVNEKQQTTCNWV